MAFDRGAQQSFRQHNTFEGTIVGIIAGQH